MDNGRAIKTPKQNKKPKQIKKKITNQLNRQNQKQIKTKTMKTIKNQEIKIDCILKYL
jgi:hypothetical protein